MNAPPKNAEVFAGNNTRPKPWMLVDNSEWDRDLFARACRRCNLPHPLVILADGREAMNYFEGITASGDGAGFACPTAVFIDLQMPDVTGVELLTWMQDRSELDGVVRIILTDSDILGEEARCLDLGATHILCKPTRFDGLAQLVSEILNWLQNAKAPGQRMPLRVSGQV